MITSRKAGDDERLRELLERGKALAEKRAREAELQEDGPSEELFPTVPLPGPDGYPQNDAVNEPADPYRGDPSAAPFAPFGQDRNASNSRIGQPPFMLVHMATNEGFAVDRPSLLIGSGPDCDLVVERSDGAVCISHNHCYVTIKRDRFYIKDVSRNGCSLGCLGAGNARFLRLPPETEVEVKPGQVIDLAGERFLLVR